MAGFKKWVWNVLQEPLMVALVMHTKANGLCKGHRRTFLVLRLITETIGENPELSPSWSLKFLCYCKSFCLDALVLCNVLFLSWCFYDDRNSFLKLMRSPLPHCTSYTVRWSHAQRFISRDCSWCHALILMLTITLGEE